MSNISHVCLANELPLVIRLEKSEKCPICGFCYDKDIKARYTADSKEKKPIEKKDSCL